MANDSNSINSQTLWVSVAVALVVGFLAGVLYSSLRGGPTTAGPRPVASAGSPIPAPPAAIQAQTEGAIALLKKQLAADPKDLDAWVKLGNLYFDSNQYQQAISAYNQYLALNPKNANVLTDLGVMYRGAGKFKEALSTFDRAIAVEPEQVQARFNKGIVLLNDLHDPQAAIEVWQKLEDDHPGVSANGIPVSEALKEAKRLLAGKGKAADK